MKEFSYKSHFSDIIKSLNEELINFYSDRLISIALFGSVGRDTFQPESDIDILIILKSLPRGRNKRFFEFYDNVYKKIELKVIEKNKFGLYIQVSPVIKSVDEINYGSPLLIELAEKCQILFDRDDFLKNKLTEIKDKMKKYGTRKMPFKGRYYWKIKEDFKWGDEIEL